MLVSLYWMLKYYVRRWVYVIAALPSANCHRRPFVCSIRRRHSRSFSSPSSLFGRPLVLMSTPRIVSGYTSNIRVSIADCLQPVGDPGLSHRKYLGIALSRHRNCQTSTWPGIRCPKMGKAASKWLFLAGNEWRRPPKSSQEQRKPLQPSL